MAKRLTGGTPSGDTGIFSIKHICALLRMTLEENSIKYKFGWARKYPQTAHDLLGQVYFRGLEVRPYPNSFPIHIQFSTCQIASVPWRKSRPSFTLLNVCIYMYPSRYMRQLGPSTTNLDALTTTSRALMFEKLNFQLRRWNERSELSTENDWQRQRE
jgi:hypothetical protein